jgi:hypothetical protein
MKHASVRLPVFLAFLILLVSVHRSAASEPGGAQPRFKAAGGGEFEFNTGVLSGKLRAEGKSVGLLPVVHVPTDAVLTRSMGFAGHYRVFSANHRYGEGAWYWPSEAKLLANGAVEVHWPAAGDRPFEMWAVYRWARPDTLDVETRVRPQAELRDFELFLASYFSEAFTSSTVRGHDPAGQPAFLPADEANGVWQMFPRDRDVVRLIQDGRWKIEPHPVDWVIRPALTQPIAVRRDVSTGTTAVLMAPPEDCFAVATPHQREPHYSLYLSLFGRTIKPGELVRARVRLAILTSPSEAQILGVYRAYLEDLSRSR